MTTAYSTNLGLALPVQGDLDGTWGDTVNNGITQYLDVAISGTLTLNGDGAVTLANTNGNSVSTNIGATTAQYAILKITGTTTTKVITAPTLSKAYMVINSSSYPVTIKASGQTGVSIPAGEKALVAFNGTDYVFVGSSQATGSFTDGQLLIGNSATGSVTKATITGGSNISVTNGNGSITIAATGLSSGTVTSVSVASANGFAGTVANPTTTPAITLTTSLTGLLKGNGTAMSAATANTDYLIPALANTAVTGFKTATFNSQTTIATTTGSITVDWTTAQNQKQAEPTGTITYTFTAPPGPCHLQLLIDSDGTSTAQTINWPGSVVWLNATWVGTNNKKAVINFWYDGTNYYAMGVNQV